MQTHTERYTETDRQREMQTERHTDMHTEGDTDTDIDRADIHTIKIRQADKERHTDRKR